MATVNFARREILCKIVYYGPGLCGKTTNLQAIHGKVPEKMRGNLTSVATKQDRTLFFDLLPIEIGKIKEFSVRLQLYTVPGQVYYNASRKIVLKGVDGVVFVADSQRGKMDENHESLQNLKENLVENGADPTMIPLVLQYNKRDLSPVYTIEELNEGINPTNLSYFESVATTGQGVFHTLKKITSLVVEDIKVKLEAVEHQPAVAAAAAAAVQQPQAAAVKPPPSREEAVAARPVAAEPARPAAPPEPVAEEESDSDEDLDKTPAQKGLWGKVSGLFKRTGN